VIALPYKVEALTTQDRANFSCGKASLDKYLKETVGQDTREDLSRCFVLIHIDEPQRILGYYTLANAGIAPQQGPARSQKVKRYPQIGALLLGRFAIDQSQQGQGLGRKLLLHILQHIATLSEESGFQLLLVDPLDDEAKAFYEKFGFSVLPSDTRMYMLLKDLRATLASLNE
jgi:ribosomal protein S18 acetylase RimI-like enzyme